MSPVPPPPTTRGPFYGAFHGRSVWLSGHTGFKGSWLAEWLLRLGAHVHGFSLPSPTSPALFEQLDLQPRLASHQIGDIRDAASVRQSIDTSNPDFVFHLAAQPLVRRAYDLPSETWHTNVVGTLNVLEALRPRSRPCTAILITTDKVYENREWIHGYREEDPLGGHDPYSASKAAAEILIASHRRSFFLDHPVRIASARAGNVIGGGDWAENRIVPDCIRALLAGKPVTVRNPWATRPWQHVLEPLSGYLHLAARLATATHTGPQPRSTLQSAFNFGPGHDANRNVQSLVEEVLKHWPGQWNDGSDPSSPHEANLLQLATDKAHAFLQWAPVWNFKDSVRETILWYRATSESAGHHARRVTESQIAAYEEDAQTAGAVWHRVQG